MSTNLQERRAEERPMASLLSGTRVVSIGIADFAESLWRQGVPCVHVDWSPAAAQAQDEDIHALLDWLL